MIPQALQTSAIIGLHREAILRYGGDATERQTDEQCAERSVAAAVMGAGYMAESGPPNILHVAALALFYIASNHCFVDGNKRVAWMAMINYLLGEGLTVVGSTDEVVEFVRTIAAGESNQDSVVEWLSADGRLASAEG